MIFVTQSWDDAVTDDIRLVELLRKYKAQATFNIIADGNKAEWQSSNWQYLGQKEVFMLARRELPALYEGFEVASHSVTHPHLDKLPADKLTWELTESRRQLEDLFQRPVRGFAYPYGSFNEAVKTELRRQGYVYGRTAIPGPEYTAMVGPSPVYNFPPVDPMEFGTTTHQNNPAFWDEFARAKEQGNYFHFWGHSYEFLDDRMWAGFEEKLARLSADADVRWVTNLGLFAP